MQLPDAPPSVPAPPIRCNIPTFAVLIPDPPQPLVEIPSGHTDDRTTAPFPPAPPPAVTSAVSPSMKVVNPPGEPSPPANEPPWMVGKPAEPPEPPMPM